MAGNRVISAVLTLKDKNFGTTAQKSASAMKNLERETKHSANTVKNFGKSATSSFKSVATGAASIVAAIGVTKALSGAFNMVRSSISSAFSRIDTMEQFDRVMTTMLGSTKAANDALEATNDIVSGTAYGLDTAAGSVQRFTTSGTDIDKTTGYVAAFGDAVAFYGDGSDETFSRVNSAMAEMATSGTASLGQVRTLTEANIPVFQIYADAVGKNADEVQKSLERGEISAEKFLDTLTGAMVEGTESFESIDGAAKEAGASWSGSFANMRSAVTRGTQSIVKSIDEMLESNGLPDMRTMVASFGKTFENVLKGVSEKIPMVTDFLVNLYEQAKPGLDWIKDEGFPAMQEGIGFAVDKAKELYDMIVNNWSTIGPVVAGVAATIAAFKIGVIAVTAATTTWNAVTKAVQIATALLNGTLTLSPLGWVALAIGAVVAAGIALYQNWDTVKAKATELWAAINERFPWIQDIISSALNPVKRLLDRIVDTWEKFKSALSNFQLPGWVSTIGDTISGAASTVSGWISGSHATGLNRVPHDGYIAELHKDEMVVPASQSRALRQQGINIDNIDQARPQEVKQVTHTNTSHNKQSSKNENNIYITVDAKDKSPEEFANKFVPILKDRLANL